MSAGILEHDQMAYAKQKPWHGLGVYVGEELMSAEEAIQAATLDWKVEKWPLTAIQTASDPLNSCDTDYFAVVRTDKQIPLGIVASRYTPIQNREVFGFFDHLVKEGEGIYETVGSLFNGRKIWILAKLKDVLIIENAGKRDVTNKYILLSSGHDGKSSLQAMVTPIRVVCQNTLNMALGHCQNKISVRHTANAATKIEEAHRVMELSTKYYEEVGKICQFLSGKPISRPELMAYADEIFPDTKAERSAAHHLRDKMVRCFDEEAGKFSPSWFSAVNAVTGVIDHASVITSLKQQRKVDSIWFGSGAALKEKAFDYAVARTR